MAKSQPDTLQDAQNLGSTLAKEGFSATDIHSISNSIMEDNKGSSDSQLSQALQTAEQAATLTK